MAEKTTIRLTEAQLNAIVKEQVETMIEEGFFDNVKAAFNGAKQGYKAQRAIDQSTDGFKRHHDYEDLQAQSNPFGPGMKNTAAEEANAIYKQYKEYSTIANRLLSKYNQFVKKYGLVKQGVGQVAEPTENPNFKARTGAPVQRKSAYAAGGKQDPGTPTLR